MRNALLPLAGAAAVLAAGQARATGYELREQSALGQGVSFAGSAARNDDPSMMFFNPAAMAGLRGVQGAVVGSGIFPSAEAERGQATRNALFGNSTITGRVDGDIALDAFVPAGYGTVEVAPGWTVGLALTSPWGLVTKNGADSIARYHALTSSLKTVNVAPAVAWQVTPTLSVGAALQAQYATARLSTAVDFGAVGASQRLPLRPGSADGRSTVRGDDWAVGWQVGAQWEPWAGTRLGLAYRSAIFHELEGDAGFEGVPFPLNRSAAFAGTRARAKLVTPETATLGLSQRLDARWTLLAGLEWTNWSRFRDLVVDFANGRPSSVTEERWRDSVFVSLGGEYRVTDTITLRAGAAYDQTPVRNTERTPRIPDNDRYWLSIGASWQATRNITLTAGYTHIFVDDARVSLRDPGPNNTNLLRGNLDATYTGSVDIVALQARWVF